ncbi:MAG TPA: SDR family oxidoreductase [Bryobacteraceae bacterium]|nr:SDR family oxidoreductase [Bryobacteraceae bacterium]
MRSPHEVNVLITGAGRGIGKRLAIGFAKNKARVGLLGRSQGELSVTKLEIEDGGGSALQLRADVRNFEQMTAAVDRMMSQWGQIDTLICNAAVQGPIGSFAAQKPSTWQEVFETNIIGVMNSCRAVLPRMLAKRAGKIIVITAQGCATPRPRFAPYAASKAAIVRFVECVAEEVREDNVQVNCMEPGETYTSMTDEILHAGERAGVHEIETAEKIQVTGGTLSERQIQLALFLASERSNHLSGKLLYVQDDWKKLEHDNARPDAFTLRRHLK